MDKCNFGLLCCEVFVFLFLDAKFDLVSLKELRT